jgi:predicted aconitase
MEWKEKAEYVCEVCGSCCTEYLQAQNPFAPDLIIVGCPKCKEVNTLFRLCDARGCRSIVTCGTPTPDGYRLTCDKHAPESA